MVEKTEHLTVSELIYQLRDIAINGDSQTRDEIVDAAEDIVETDYHRSIRSMAEDLKAAIKSGDITDRDDLIERLEQDVDGCYWVIYTHANFTVLRYSRNDSAYFDEMGESTLPSESWSATLACFAVRQDVIEALEYLDVDINDPIPEPEEEESSGDDEELTSETEGERRDE